MERFEGLTLLHYTGIVLAAVSGVIHFYLAPVIGLNGLGLSFAFAGLGFFAGIILVVKDFHRKKVYLLGIPFTVGQIVLWYFINRPDLSLVVRGEPLLEAVDKFAQVFLTFLLVYLYFDER